MQTDLTNYQDMLAWTGGAPSLHKCFYSILTWKFSADGLPSPMNNKHTLQIPQTPTEQADIQQVTTAIRHTRINPLCQHQLEQLTGSKLPQNPSPQDIQEFCCKSEQPVIITQKSAHDQQISLGLKMTADGNTTGAEEHFERQNRKFGLNIVASNLQPPEVKLAHRAVHLPSQSYKFYGSPFSEKFLSQESHRTTTKLLPRMNLSRNHPLALQYAPKNRGGQLLPHYYVVQGTILVKQALKHIRLQSSLGINLGIHLQWTQHHTGLQTGILTDTKTDLSYIPSNWWTKMRQFLHYIQGELRLEQQYTIPPLQTNNRSIMSDLLGVFKWQKKELKRINVCRLFLQVTYISELSTNGTTLDLNADY